jgi:hypothetical protein
VSVLAHVWVSVTLIEMNTSCNENQVFGEGSGFSVSYQASSFSIIKTKSENQLKRAVMVTVKLQNKWTWITDQEKFEMLLCYHTTEGGLICAVFYHVPKQRILI